MSRRIVQPVRLVCFDLGGVLVRICRSLAEACSAAGIEIRHDEDTVASQHSGGIHTLTLDLQTGRIDRQHFAERFSKLLDGLYQPHEIESIHESWLRGEYDGAASFVRTLRNQGLTTAALSNTDGTHWKAMEAYPVIQSLEYRLGSHLLGVAKPDMEAFRAVEEATGICGDEIAYFDDLPENVEAALTCGWRAHAIDPLKPTVPQMRSRLQEAGIQLQPA